eukprot:COSAG01_NODE_8513_length_2759_cov_1.120301_2_plen_120_part_00
MCHTPFTVSLKCPCKPLSWFHHCLAPARENRSTAKLCAGATNSLAASDRRCGLILLTFVAGFPSSRSSEDSVTMSMGPHSPALPLVGGVMVTDMVWLVGFTYLTVRAEPSSEIAAEADS